MVQDTEASHPDPLDHVQSNICKKRSNLLFSDFRMFDAKHKWLQAPSLSTYTESISTLYQVPPVSCAAIL